MLSNPAAERVNDFATPGEFDLGVVSQNRKTTLLRHNKCLIMAACLGTPKQDRHHVSFAIIVSRERRQMRAWAVSNASRYKYRLKSAWIQALHEDVGKFRLRFHWAILEQKPTAKGLAAAHGSRTQGVQSAFRISFRLASYSSFVIVPAL